MKVIGLTGNMGCGKSTVAAMLRELGAAHIDADAVVREIRQNDGEARAAIERRFGRLDTRRLGEIVFGNPDALRDLEAILHPPFRDAVRSRLAELSEAGVPATVVEVIKLLESPLHDACDAIWVVVCDEADALARVMADRGLDKAEAQARLANQSPQAVKAAAADVVIDGSASLEETRRQVRAAYAQLMGQPGG
jgi:dephospho-CoA kinase